MKNITYLVVAVLLGISGIAQSSVDVSEDEYVVFYHHDVLGSPVATTDDQGRVLWYEYSQPYGKGMGRKNTDGEGFKDNAIEEASSRMGYTGHTVDNIADLVYMKARYYDPVIGRFYSNDPVGFTTANPMMFNRYAYANNNPYLYIDPDGRFVDTFLDVVTTAYEVGQFLGAGAATVVGVVSGDNALYDAGLSGMSAEWGDVALSAGGLVTPGVPSFAVVIAAKAKKLDSIIPDGVKPPSLSPEGAGRAGAFKEAKRNSGIPASQQPSAVKPNIDNRGNRQPGRTYEFEVPADGGGKKTVQIRDDSAGHNYGTGDSQNRGSHFNDEDRNHYEY